MLWCFSFCRNIPGKAFVWHATERTLASYGKGNFCCPRGMHFDTIGYSHDGGGGVLFLLILINTFSFTALLYATVF